MLGLVCGGGGEVVEHFRLWELVGGSSVLIMGGDIFFGLGGGV